MPWQEVSTMSLRKVFVMLAGQEGANMAALCRGFGISRKTGYKWLQRAAAKGQAGFDERSRRLHHCPGRTAPAVEQAVAELGEPLPEDPAAAAATINRAMERLILQCPEQYLWGYNRYKQPRREGLA